MRSHRNATHAFTHGLKLIKAQGRSVQVRGAQTYEITAQGFTLDQPLERCITMQHRQNRIAATIAETMWVLAGRNDIDWLSLYLPRAADYSDDGVTWRAAYGPRLRRWCGGTDQLASVRSALLEERSSRRAVAVLFDPAQDYQSSRDVPCANWLHFLVRDDRLDLMVTARSNDLIWGFSGINAFEWSVVHELMASWVGVPAGRQHHFVSSLHYYERHLDRASHILEAWSGTTIYDVGAQRIPYAGTWEELDGHLEEWFRVEALVRSDPHATLDVVESFPEPMMRSFLHVIRAFWLLEAGALDEFTQVVQSLTGTDLGDALTEWGSRSGACTWSPPAPRGTLDIETLISAVANLHRAKSTVYGDSWKRRGEVLGIMANVARKVDRLEALDVGVPAGEDESTFDTLVDLLVYLLKYQTWLADEDGIVRVRLFGDEATGQASEGSYFFDILLERTMTVQPSSNASIPGVINHFRALEALFIDGRASATPLQRLGAVEAMVADCRSVITEWAELNPRQATRYVARALQG